MSENIDISNCTKAQLLAQLARLELKDNTETSKDAMSARHPVEKTSKLAMVNIHSGKEGATSSAHMAPVSATIADIPEIKNFMRREVRTSHTEEDELRTSNSDSWAMVIEDFIEATGNSNLTRKRYRKHINSFKTFVKDVNQPKQLKKEH